MYIKCFFQSVHIRIRYQYIPLYICVDVLLATITYDNNVHDVRLDFTYGYE